MITKLFPQFKTVIDPEKHVVDLKCKGAFLALTYILVPFKEEEDVA